MCGITGILLKEGMTVQKNTLARMNNTLFHRGPDDGGMFIEENFGFAMRRLSIIDIEGGKQPLWSEDERFSIVFNGEIYNSPALRIFLEKKGHCFKTRTDTECIIHLYEEYGEDCVQHLRGMFAFAIWDRREKILFLARDRLGIKPLSYAETQDAFLFASELKSFLCYPGFSREMDEEAIDLYFTLLYIPAPKTIYKHARKLPAGHTMTLHRGERQLKRYWTPPHTSLSVSEADATEHLRHLLDETVKMHLFSDVPVGVFLSGGIDSSTITAIASQSYPELRTFTVGFEETQYNEFPFAKSMAQKYGTRHTEINVKAKDIHLAENVIAQMGEPFADSSFLLTYIIAKEARKHVKVCLSGDGGDELFGGYPWMTKQKYIQMYKSMPAPFQDMLLSFFRAKDAPQGISTSPRDTLKRFLYDATLTSHHGFVRRITCFNQEEKKHFYTDDFYRHSSESNPAFFLLKNYLHADNTIDTFMQFDLNVYLPDDILWKVDRMSMLNSLEVRPPFLDHELVEFITALPYSMKSFGFVGKRILRNAVSSLLPEETLTHKKQGFSMPLEDWFRTDLRSWMQDLLQDSKTADDGYFNKTYLQELFNSHLSGKVNVKHHLWSYAVLELWYRNVSKKTCDTQESAGIP